MSSIFWPGPENANNIHTVLDYYNVAQTPWPDNVQLFQPTEATQILLPDSANCLSVQTYLRMCNLEYNIVERHNAEYMAPTGKVPFLKCGAFLVPELEGVIRYLDAKEISLTSDLDILEKADLRAFTSLVNNVLLNAELYIMWCDPEVYKEVTWKRTASPYPFPLNYMLTYGKKQRAIKRLKALQWYEKSLDDVYGEVDTCCKSLSDRLEDKQFFFRDKPTELDALVYAHIFTIISTPLPTNKLAGIVHCFTNIVDHCKRIDSLYFSQNRVQQTSTFSKKNEVKE